MVETRHFDRLVFLAHSQGTIIIHDSLRAVAGTNKLAGPRDIHVLTLASPLTHLYQHYFEEYRQAAMAPSWLPRNLVSWSNIWRIDDPIADAVRLAGPPAIAHGVLGLGGHVDYWREPDVLGIVHRLLTMEAGDTDIIPAAIRVHPRGRINTEVAAGMQPAAPLEAA